MKKHPKPSEEYMLRQKETMRRKHRVVVMLNDKEKEALDEYCRLLKVSSVSSVFRQAMMERVLEALDENHPTLF